MTLIFLLTCNALNAFFLAVAICLKAIFGWHSLPWVGLWILLYIFCC